MTKERARLLELLDMRKKIDAEIKSLTSSASRKMAYNELLRECIWEYVNKQYKELNAYAKYAKYRQIRGSVGKEVGITSQLVTLSDYILAIDFFENTYNCAVSNKYKIGGKDTVEFIRDKM